MLILRERLLNKPQKMELNGAEVSFPTKYFLNVRLVKGSFIG